MFATVRAAAPFSATDLVGAGRCSEPPAGARTDSAVGAAARGQPAARPLTCWCGRGGRCCWRRGVAVRRRRRSRPSRCSRGTGRAVRRRARRRRLGRAVCRCGGSSRRRSPTTLCLPRPGLSGTAGTSRRRAIRLRQIQQTDGLVWRTRLNRLFGSADNRSPQGYPCCRPLAATARRDTIARDCRTKPSGTDRRFAQS